MVTDFCFEPETFSLRCAGEAAVASGRVVYPGLPQIDYCVRTLFDCMQVKPIDDCCTNNNSKGHCLNMRCRWYAGESFLPASFWTRESLNTASCMADS